MLLILQSCARASETGDEGATFLQARAEQPAVPLKAPEVTTVAPSYVNPNFAESQASSPSRLGAISWQDDVQINFSGPTEDLEIIRQAISHLPNIRISVSLDQQDGNFFIRPFGMRDDIVDQRYRAFGHGGWHVFRGSVTFDGNRDWPDYHVWNKQGYVFQLHFLPIDSYAENSNTEASAVRKHMIRFKMYDSASINIDGLIIVNKDKSIKFAECNYFVYLPKFIKKKLIHECMLRGLGLVKETGEDSSSLMRKYLAADVDKLPITYSPEDRKQLVRLYALSEIGDQR